MRYTINGKNPVPAWRFRLHVLNHWWHETVLGRVCVVVHTDGGPFQHTWMRRWMWQGIRKHLDEDSGLLILPGHAYIDRKELLKAMDSYAKSPVP